MSEQTFADLAAKFYGGKPEPTAPTETAGKPQTLAESIYGSKPESSAQAPAAEPTERTTKEVAEAIYGKPQEAPELDRAPQAVQELRDNPARKLYSAQDTFRDVIAEVDAAQLQELGVTAEDARKGAAEMREVFADLDFTKRDALTLRDRAERLLDAPMDAIAQRESAVEALNREFGNDAAQAWRDARALVARDPRVAKLIDMMGLGDDPDTVLLLARKARSQRMAGKLKGG